MNHPYYIFAPDFAFRSEGTRALHHLCDALNAAGEEAWIFGAEVLNPDLNTPVLTREICMRHEAEGRLAIGVYPEIVCSNLFNTPVVVHWMLNRDGLITGNKINAGKDDLFFYYQVTFTPDTREQFDFLCIAPRLFDTNLFKPDPGRARKHPLLYINRVPETDINFSALPAEIEILSNQRPLPFPQLAEKLQGAPLLYTYEYSGTCTLAMLCGCPVVALEHPQYPQLGFTQSVIDHYPCKAYAFSDAPEAVEEAKKHLTEVRESFLSSDRIFLRQLTKFIRKTQAAAQNTVAGEHIPSRAYFLTWKTVRILLNQAERALKDGNGQAAQGLLETAFQTDPGEPLVHVAMALASARAGDLKTAKDFIFSALKAASGNAAFLACHNEAVTLLQEIARQPSTPPENNIPALLVNILAERGDITGFIESLRAFPASLGNLLLTARTLTHYEETGMPLQETLQKIRTQLAEQTLPVTHDATPLLRHPENPVKIVFMAGNFARENALGRLLPILRHLPPDRFSSWLISTSPQNNDYLNLCAASAHQFWMIHQDDDPTALRKIQALQADILIDLDAYDPMERLPVFAALAGPQKLLWGEAPLPPLLPDTQILAGAYLDVQDLLPVVPLPEMGEFYDLPDIPLAANAPFHAAGATVFGCLTPTIRIGQNGWSLFAEILQRYPQSRLLLNQEDLGEAAKAFVQSQFARANIATERLSFVRAYTAEELCKHWRTVDLGLAPPVDSGDMALPTCLWMGKPYLALSSPLPWSRRPVALLETAGATEWIAKTRDDYIERAGRPTPAPNPDFRARLKPLTDPIRFARGFAGTLAELVRHRKMK